MEKKFDPNAIPSFEDFKKAELARLDKQIKSNNSILYWSDMWMQYMGYIAGDMPSVKQIKELVEREERLLRAMKERLEALIEEDLMVEDYPSNDIYKELIISPDDIETEDPYDYFCATQDYMNIRAFGEYMIQYWQSRKWAEEQKETEE